MNENEFEFEERLRALRPIAPSPEVANSLARELHSRELALRVPTAAILAHPAAPARTLPGILRGLGWACAGACVAVAAIVASERGAERPQPAPLAGVEPPPAFDFAESSAEILTAQDEGFVYAADEAPARRVRFNSIERHVWTDASTGRRMEIEIPREDVRLTPVAMQ